EISVVDKAQARNRLLDGVPRLDESIAPFLWRAGEEAVVTALDGIVHADEIRRVDHRLKRERVDSGIHVKITRQRQQIATRGGSERTQKARASIPSVGRIDGVEFQHVHIE